MLTKQRSCEHTARWHLCLHLGRGSLSRRESTATLILDFQPPELLFKPPSLWYFVTEPEMTKTDVKEPSDDSSPLAFQALGLLQISQLRPQTSWSERRQAYLSYQTLCLIKSLSIIKWWLFYVMKFGGGLVQSNR